jgi:pyridoxal phosphate-dependent aminotransferase EpsN
VSDRILLSAPEAGDDERALLLDALDSGWITPAGPHVDAFEQEIAERAGVPHAAALSSGTAAMELALRLLGVQRGDRVLVPSFTFIGTVSPVVHLGAEPVFVDSEPASWNLDPDLVARELERSATAGALPAAVVAVDLYGQCADYARLEPLCAEYDVPLVEDAAEALGATRDGRPAGSFGVCAVFSFNGNKIITTSGGGALVARDQALVARARHLATQARAPAPHYEHEEVGFNYRLSNVCAALGRGQLHGLDRKVRRRRDVFDRYVAGLGDLPGVSFMPEAGATTRWLTVLTIDSDLLGVDRETIRLRLDERGIETRPAWKPMHLQPVFGTAEMLGGAVCEQIFRDGLCLPSGTGLSDADVDRVVAEFRAACGRSAER